MRVITTFSQYRRRLDVFDYQPRRHDVPRDITELLILVEPINITVVTIPVDVPDNRE